jgi:hypothetical protein
MDFDLDRHVGTPGVCLLFASSVYGGQHFNTNKMASDVDEISSSNSIFDSTTNMAVQCRQRTNAFL